MTRRTKPLFQLDEALREHEAQIQSIQRIDELDENDRQLFKTVQSDAPLYVVTTDETIFYAQGGGQPSDIGILTSLDSSSEITKQLHVLLVRSTSDGRILHAGHFTNADATIFTARERIHQKIDGARRDLHSRIHSAGHLVSLAVRALLPSPNASVDLQPVILGDVAELKAQHYPETSFVDFRGSIPADAKAGIQAQVDKFVQQDLPTKLYWLTEAEVREKCAFVPEGFDFSTTLAKDGEDWATKVRVVDIEGAGAYPCGGTHVASSSVCGQVKIRKISRSKGTSKISYECP